jgi:adenine deaminase
MKSYQGILVDTFSKRLFKGEITLENGKITRVEEKEHGNNTYILPGLIDAHVHIESSMMIPSVFSKMAVSRGTVAVVCDPHEIANVIGIEGIDYMLEDSRKTPLKFWFGVPSCVPATPFETSGAVLDAQIVDSLLARKDMHYLSEMMNFPGVISEVPEVLAKLASAEKYGKPVDGHAPGLTGAALQKYAASGISTDHECSSYEEALEKIKLGMKILIREGSAAKNFEALFRLIDEFPASVMLCTDDSHPDTLLYEGHIDKLLRRGLEKGLDIFNLIRAASVNPVEHYGLSVGLLREGDPADFIVVDDLKSFQVLATFIGGECVYSSGKVLFEGEKSPVINRFLRNRITAEDLLLPARPGKIRVIIARAGELLTGQELASPRIERGYLVSDPSRDILKLVVLSRYGNDPVRIGFIKNFGLKKGALASSIAHDSHNIIAVGVADEDIVAAVNKLVENKGGIVAGTKDHLLFLPFEVAGLMSTRSGEEVAAMYLELNAEAQKLGTQFEAPFMTLSFMSLLVIPSLKLGDQGLFDVNKFEFVDLFVDNEKV